MWAELLSWGRDHDEIDIIPRSRVDDLGDRVPLLHDRLDLEIVQIREVASQFLEIVLDRREAALAIVGDGFHLRVAKIETSRVHFRDVQKLQFRVKLVGESHCIVQSEFAILAEINRYEDQLYVQ